MKKRTTLFLLAVLLSTSVARAQGSIAYKIHLIDNNSLPVAGILIRAVETTSLKVVRGKTDNNGDVLLELDGGRKWSISLGAMKDQRKVNAIPGSTIEMNELLVYDLEGYNRKKQQDKDRQNEGFKVKEHKVIQAPTEPNECVLVVLITHPNGRKLEGIEVDLVNIKDSIIYRSQTSSSGIAQFNLPNQHNYEIDIEGFKNYSYVDFGNERVKKTVHIEYAPTVIDEKVINDTIYQNATALTKPSSVRALMKIRVLGGKRNGKNERVYLRTLDSNKVYTNKTTDEGIAYFSLPVRHIYMIDFEYQKDADAINLMFAREMAKGEMSVTYKPDPRLEYPERFIPTPEELFVRKFNSFLTKQFEQPKDRPFLLKIVSAKKIHRDSREALFKLTFASPDAYGDKKRIPLNVAFVLDKSGSMYSDERAESLKKSLLEIGNELKGDDQVAVVLFDTEAASIPQSDDDHRSRFQRIIENYSPGGGTNIYKGLQTGFTSLSENYDVDRSNRLILLTDGYGVTPPKELTDYLSSKFEQGYEFSAVGLGTSYNQALLELMAQKGNGTFSHVDNSSALTETFLREVKSSFHYLAKDLTIEIYHNENLVYSQLYGFPLSNATANRISFEIDKVPTSVNQLAFLKFKINEPSMAIESQPLKIKVSYFDMVKNEKVSYEQEVRLEWTEETDAELLMDQEEKKLYAIAVLNQTLKTMAEAFEVQNHHLAKQELKRGIQQMEEIFPEAKPKEVRKIMEEVEQYILAFNRIERNARR
jgi:Ca-activated chloride channel family protein